MFHLKFAKVIFAILLFSSLTFSQWYQQYSGVNSQFFSVTFINPSTGFVAGTQGKVLRTTNAGVNWIVSTILDTLYDYRTIDFINSNTGYIAGCILVLGNNFQAEPKIIKTTNGGLNWFSSFSDSGYTLWSIAFIDQNTGYATGGLFSASPGKLIKTTNGGINWQVIQNFGDGYPKSIIFTDANTGYTTHYQGYIMKTLNAGLNWNIISTMSVTVLSSINFLDVNTGFTAGGIFYSIGADSTGRIYKTVNSGSNWNLIYHDTLGVVNYIKFINSNTGFGVGSYETSSQYPLPGRILKSTNSGNNWFIDTVFDSFRGLSSLFFTDQNTGYVVGANGVILKTTTGGNPIGITPISKEVPVHFSLSQNYPNPFNPSTTIEFDIPKESNVKITVYDILGNETQILVNENLNAGKYQIKWNGTKYSSGIYYYKIQASDFVQTRKMVLVK